MMVIDSDAVKALEEAVDARIKTATKSKSSTHVAEVLDVDSDGTVWVHVFGGAEKTPATTSLASVSKGDIVSATIANGSVTVNGSSSSPSATVTYVDEMNLAIGEYARNAIAGILGDVVKVKTLIAEKASIEDLVATNATVSQLTADYANLNTVVAGKVDTAYLQANYATLGALSAVSADVEDLTADYAELGTVVAGKIDATYASLHYAEIDLANVNNAWIEDGTIKDGVITNAMIGSLSANKLTAGTINGANINVTNLNADNITTGTINGQRIGAGSLSLDKLSEDVYTESEIDAKLDTMQAEIDGAIETWTGTDRPTLQNSPASGWTTADDRHKHVGDVYFVVNSNSQYNGYNYRFTENGTYPNATYEWVHIQDNDVQAALGRIQTVEGEITQFDSDISDLKTDTGSLKTRTTNLETRMTTAEGNISDKVSTSTFNELSSTVDTNSATITSMSTVISNNGLTESTNISQTVNTVQQTASGNSSVISQLVTTLGTNVDGTTKTGDVVQRTSAVEQDLSSFKTTVSSTYATQTNLDNVANRQMAYSATSSTGASTATKEVSCANFPALAAGATVTVRFSVANTATSAIKLNVNSTGDKTVYVNGATTGSSNQLLWAANANITFTYDGTYWRVVSEPRSWYGTCSTAAGTAAKTSAINEVVVCKGTTISLNMTNENTSTSATLNVGSTAAKNVYYGTTTTSPTTENGFGWTAASTASFVFDGQYWRIGDTSALSKLMSMQTTISTHTTQIAQNAEAIELKASQTDMDALTGRVSTAETNISTNAGNIALKASQTEVDGLTGRVSTAESNITANATAIDLRVEKSGVIAAINASTETSGGSTVKISADKVNIEGAAIFSNYSTTSQMNTAIGNAVDNIKIGGRNYVLNSAGVLADKRGSASESRNEYVALDLGQSYMDVPEGTQVTVSFDLVMDVATANPTLQVYNTNNDGPKCFRGTAGHGEAAGKTVSFTAAVGSVINERVSVTGYIGDRDNPSKSTNWLEIYSVYNTGNFFSIANLKLEVGNKATDWTPAPEDQIAYVDNLEIGGTNLLRNTNTLTEADLALARSTVSDNVITLTPTTSSAYAKFVVDYLDYLEYGSGTYTVSFDAKKGTSSYTSTKGPFVYLGFNASSRAENIFSASYDKYRGYELAPVLDSSWKRYTQTFNVPNDLTAGTDAALTTGSNLTVQFGMTAQYAPMLVRNVKLERGTKATDWAPAPEDTVYREQTIYIQATSVLEFPDIPQSWVVESSESVSEDELLRPNMLYETPKTHNESAYLAYAYSFKVYDEAEQEADKYEILEADTEYTLNLFDVDVMHSAKTSAQLGLMIYYNGGAIKFGGWKGLDYFSAADENTGYSHADRLRLTFTPHTSAVADTDGGNEAANQNMSHANASIRPAVLNIYNSVPSASGTMYMRIGSCHLSKGPKVDAPQWSTKPPTYRSIYPVTFVATQTQLASGEVLTTTPVVDDTNTVIDGGRIITGTLDATKVNVINLDASNITSGYLDANRIDTTNLVVSQTNVVGLGQALDAKADSTNVENSLSAMSTMIGGVSSNVDQVRTDLTGVTDNLDGRVSEIESHVTIGSNALGQPSITLDAMGGTSDISGMSAELTNTALSFLDHGNVVSYISNQKMYITEAEITESMALGNFAFIPLSDGSLAFKWTGAVNGT